MKKRAREDFYGWPVDYARQGGDDLHGPVSQLHFLLQQERLEWTKRRGYKSSQLYLRINQHDLEFLYSFILSCSVQDARRALELELATSKLMLFSIEVVVDNSVRRPEIKLRRFKLLG